MPGVPQIPDQRMQAMLANHEMRLRALETQQQNVISNLNGESVINFGLIPGTNPPQYGLQFVDPSSGNPIMFLGVDATGAPGLHVYDDSGTEQVRLGEINTSPAIYGLGVLPFGGSELQQVGGFLQASPPDVVSANTGGVFTAFGSPNSVTFEVGPSGQFALTVCAYLQTLSANQQISVGFSVDGGTVGSIMSLSDAQGPCTASVSSETIQGATTGEHTVEIFYWSTAPGSFFNPTLIVQPL